MMESMESAIRTALGVVYFFAGLICLAGVGFFCYRIYQMRTLAPVQAEVLSSETDSYLSTHTSRDSQGWSRDYTSRVYVPTAMVKYSFGGKEYTAEARHDTASSFKWFQDQLTRQFQPGKRVQVHIDPAKPDQPVPGLGWNPHTFSMGFVLILAGLIFGAFGWGMCRGAVWVMGQLRLPVH